MPLFAFTFDNFESQNLHSMNANFDQFRHIITFITLLKHFLLLLVK